MTEKTVKMKLAKATPEDFKRFWSMYRAQERLRYAFRPLEILRCQRIILGRMEELSGGFWRVVGGCETLMANCCDPELDYYEFKPEILRGLELEAAEREGGTV